MVYSLACYQCAKKGFWMLNRRFWGICNGMVPLQKNFLDTVFCIHDCAKETISDGKQQGSVGRECLFLVSLHLIHKRLSSLLHSVMCEGKGTLCALAPDVEASVSGFCCPSVRASLRVCACCKVCMTA